MTLEFRELARTGTIHIFDTEVSKELPICGRTLRGGGLTYPIQLEDVESRKVCKRCMNGRSK